MNIYKRELRSNLRSIIMWSIGMFLMIAASMVKYGAGAASGQNFTDIMKQLPAAVKAVLDAGNMLDYGNALDFYSMIYPYLLLIAAIHACMLGAVIISKEERDRTSEFLFVKPVTRSSVITSKFLAALTYVIALNVVTWVSSVAMIAPYVKGEPYMAGIGLSMIGLLLIQLLFLVIGTAAASVMKRSKGSTGIATGVVLSTYFLSIAIDINGNINWAKALSPFKYFNAKVLLGGGSYNIEYVVITVVLTAALFWATYYFYKRRDLRV